MAFCATDWVNYPNRPRVKIWGDARVVEDDPGLTERLKIVGYKARVERVILHTVAAWDANCPQHIPRCLDATAVAVALADRDRRIEELEAELRTRRQSMPKRSVG